MENLATPCAGAQPALAPTSFAATLYAVRLTLTQTGRLDVDNLIAAMRLAHRVDLIHYAGAAHRDLVAWHLCAAYLADPAADEATLKSRALKAAWGVDVSPDDIRAAGGAS